ncbi:MAG TPA: Rieske (2Fe-2S) protein [Gemmatimonadaceae bacterium]|jgi:nitrite reductase/ring-hydroxylating ferredoxin subunit
MIDRRENSMPEDARCDGGCSLHDALNAPAAIERRAFLRAGALALASLGMLGLGARAAAAMTVSEVRALAGRSGDRHEEKRYPMPTTDSVSIDRDNSVIIARAAGKIYAFSLACPHQNTALRWSADDKEFVCSKHHSHYRADGSFIEGRATRDMDRLAMRRDGQTLVVEIDTLYQQDLNLAQWTAAFIPA